MRGGRRGGRGCRAAAVRRAGGSAARRGQHTAGHERAEALQDRAAGQADAPDPGDAIGADMSHPWSLAGNAPVRSLQTQGFAMLAPEELMALTPVPKAALDAWLPLWNRLAPDEYLRDGGRYRSR